MDELYRIFDKIPEDYVGFVTMFDLTITIRNIERRNLEREMKNEKLLLENNRNSPGTF